MTISAGSYVADMGIDFFEKFDSYHKLIVGDSRQINQKELGRVQLVVTSPPYWTIKDYGLDGQIGYKQDLTDYIQSLLKVWRKCFKALEPGCRLVINIGDQYIKSKKGNPYHIIPLHSMIVNSILTDQRISDVIYLGSIIWEKISTTKTSGGASVMGSYPHPRSVYPCFENEYIAIFRKLGRTSPPSEISKKNSKLSLEDWRDLTRGIWKFPGTKMAEHPAAYPERLPERIIKMFTFPGEIVLDPFVGTGSTMAAAAKLGRNSIGIDIGYQTKSGIPFQEVIQNKIKDIDKEVFSGKATFEIVE